MANSTEANTRTDSATDQQEILAKAVEFAQLLPNQNSSASSNSLDFLRDVPITITAELGSVVMPISEILQLAPGSVVELDAEISKPVKLTVRGVPFAIGEVVVVEDRFAIRIRSLLQPRSGTHESVVAAMVNGEST